MSPEAKRLYDKIDRFERINRLANRMKKWNDWADYVFVPVEKRHEWKEDNKWITRIANRIMEGEVYIPESDKREANRLWKKYKIYSEQI